MDLLVELLLLGFFGFAIFIPPSAIKEHWKALSAITVLVMWIPISLVSLLVVMDQAEAYTFESTTGVMEESYYEKVRPYATTHMYGESVSCVYELHMAYSYSIPDSGFNYSSTAYALWDQKLRREVPDSHWTCQNTSPPMLIADFVDTNPEGATVTVYYDPSDPQRSVVHRGFEGGMPFTVTILNTFLLVALIYKLSMSYYSRMEEEENALDGVEMNDPAQPIETPVQEKLEEREKWWDN